MRRWQEEETHHARIEIVPMIDVMMFLLVFFVLLSLNVIPAAGFKLSLPTQSRPDEVKEPQIATVAVLGQGQYGFDQKKFDRESLIAVLKDRRLAQPKLSVVVMGDAQASLQSVVDAIDVVKAAGIQAVTIVTKRS